jgi:hypothetical protein
VRRFDGASVTLLSVRQAPHTGTGKIPEPRDCQKGHSISITTVIKVPDDDSVFLVLGNTVQQ